MSRLTPPKKHYGRLKNYYDGSWREPAEARYIEVLDPALGEPIAESPLTEKLEIDRAVAAAKNAWWSWRETPPLTRARLMFTMKQLLEEHFEDISRIIVQESGKTIDEARGETRRAIENVEVASGITTLQMGYSLEDGAGANIDEEVVRQPLGVFASISPFNFPAMVPFWSWPYAVACGNTFIVKPSERVPCTMQYIFGLIDKAGFPPGVVNLINGDRAAADALLEHADIKGISFVGSTPVARYIHEKCGQAGKRVGAQGGAKNCLVVNSDAVLPQTVANILSSCFGCAGQRCLAGSNLLVMEDVYDQFTERFLARAKALKIGHGLDESNNMGPVISAQALERITRYIEGAVAEGAHLLLDGRTVTVEGCRNGFFIGPTILENVRPEMTIAREEVFGPVVSLIKIKSLDEALAIIDAIPFGNAASIYTQSGKTAREFRYRVQAGNIGVNIGVPAPMAYFPFGGYKNSFFGDLHAQGTDAINFFTERKVVITRWI